MTENEQIQEMALAICKSRGVADVDDCEKCWQSDNGCLYQEIANGLYSKGYRKVERGEWEMCEKKKGVITPEARCSICKREVVYQIVDNKWEFENHCPHCGADMRKEGAE